MRKKVKKAQMGTRAMTSAISKIPAAAKAAKAAARQKKLRAAEIARVKRERASGIRPTLKPERVTGGNSTMSSMENSTRFKNANVGKKSAFTQRLSDPNLGNPIKKKPLKLNKRLSNVSKVKPMTDAQKAADKKMRSKTALKNQLKTASFGSAKRRNLYKQLGWKLDDTTKVKSAATLKADPIKKEKIAMPTAKKIKATAIKKAKPASKSTKRAVKKITTLSKKKTAATAKGKTRKAKRVANRSARVIKRAVNKTARKAKRTVRKTARKTKRANKK